MLHVLEHPLVLRRKLVVVVNPNATRPISRGQLREVVRVLRETGSEIAVEATESVQELEDLCVAADGARIVLVGGDGTVQAAAAATAREPDLEIALVPTGSANNVAHSLGIPLEPCAAAELAALGTAHPLDLIEADAGGVVTRIVEGLSVGFLARARARYGRASSGHVAAGALAGLHALVGFHPCAVHVHMESRDEELALAQLFVANLPLYAFGLQVAPHADLTDGSLDLVGLEAGSRHAVLGLVADLKRGRLLRRPGVHLWRARRARIRTSGTSPIIGDSADLGTGPVELRVLPEALRVVRPG